VHKETQELVELLPLYRQIFRAIPGGVVLVFDHELRFWIAEGEGFAAQGWETDAVEGLRLGDVVPPDRAEFLEPFYRAALAGEPQSFAVEGRKDARIFWSQIFPLRNDDGVVIAGCVLGQDVTESQEAQAALEAAERRMEAGFHSSPMGMALCGLDGRFIDVNDALAQMLQHPREELIGSSFRRFTHPDDVDENMRWLDQLVTGERETVTGPKRYVAANGDVVEVILSVAAVRSDDGRVVHLFSQMLDITERRAMEAALARAEADFRTAFEQAPSGKMLISLDGHCLRVNRVLCELLGNDEAELVGRAAHDALHTGATGLDRKLAERAANCDMSTFHVESQCVKSNGEVITVEQSTSLVVDGDGSPRHFVMQVEDISDRKRLEEELQHFAERDPLTGLLNRRRFDTELDRCRTLADRWNEPAAVIVLDLDNLKAINDRFGHRAGDELLRDVARLLTKRLRVTDISARLGGDEFAVLMPFADAAGAVALARALLEGFDRLSVRVDGHEPVTPSASVGISFLRKGSDPAEVLAAADAAMYEAKRAGGREYRIGDL
jgi:diguanylate cyclase (GGDEF)-like protein/PAS domain S-box-containing protein